MCLQKIKGMCLMTEGVNSSTSVSLSALSDLKAFFRSGAVKAENTDDTNEENKKSAV